MSQKLRVVAWRVQPILVLDDGEHLTPLPVSAQDIPAALWQEFKAGGDELAIDALRAQFESAAAPLE